MTQWLVGLCSLIELSKLLDAGQNARRDKLSVLTDAIKEVTRLRSEAVSLHRLNKILEVRCFHCS